MSASNPFNFANWLNHDGNGGDDISEDVTLGQFNQMTADLGSQATIIQVFADQNAAFVGQNSSKGDGVVGVFGESDGATQGIGVAGACDAGLGVCGVASVVALPRFGATAVGVYGVGDTAGIYGQSLGKEGQFPNTLFGPPAPGTGVYGIGDVVGVEGDTDGATSSSPASTSGVLGQNTGGKGVTGTSTSGADIGVLGQSPVNPLGAAPPALPVSPSTGVYGIGLANPPWPGNTLPRGNGTGVFGVGDHAGVRGESDTGRGGVFSSGVASNKAAAQVLLIPHRVPLADIKSTPPPPQDPPARLPRSGLAGDLIAVTVQQSGQQANITRLWFCIRSGVPQEPATWAEIQFSRTILGSGT